jgi:hypothetical protein
LADAQDLGSSAGKRQDVENTALTKDAAERGKRVGKTLGKIDPDFAKVAAAWPTLPAAIRAGIVAMVKAAKGGA